MPATFVHDFTDHQGFEQVVPAPGTGSLAVVLASACELTNPGGEPFQGQASIQVHNVVPEGSSVRVRGFIGWDSDLRVRLSVFRAAP
jgi:hypothetical protein